MHFFVAIQKVYGTGFVLAYAMSDLILKAESVNMAI